MDSLPENCDKIDKQFLIDQRIIPCFPSVSERYYSHQLFKFKNQNLNENSDSNIDLLVLSHSNRISLITLAPTHDILKLNKKVIKVDFNSDKINRLQNQVSGKWKKGAQKVETESVICVIECEDGTSYKIFSCIRGKIIEINQRLINEPSLVNTKPWTDGYIAIILPPFKSRKDTKQNIITIE